MIPFLFSDLGLGLSRRHPVLTSAFLSLAIAFTAPNLAADEGGLEVHVRTAFTPQIIGFIDGSVQSNEAGNINLNSGAEITGTLYVPGSPEIKVKGNAVPPTLIEGEGNPELVRIPVFLNNRI